MAEQRESRVWGDQGTEPDPGDETYSGSERPIAEYVNWAMWSATTDIKTLFDWLDGVETDLNNHTSSSSGVHGVGAADVASTNDVSSIQSSADVSHDNTTGGTSGTPHDHADPDDPVHLAMEASATNADPDPEDVIPFDDCPICGTALDAIVSEQPSEVLE